MFSIDLKNPDNYAGSSAPVHYPRIWNTPWFDWVQYNGSIMRPMVRNAGELLGVSSELNLTDPSKGLFKSSVNVKSLFEMEEMVRGKNPPNPKDGFSGLQSPKWPSDILPPIDQALAAKGAELYRIAVRDVTARRSRARPSTISTTKLVADQRERRARHGARKYSDRTYRHRSGAGRGHAQPDGRDPGQSRN